MSCLAVARARWKLALPAASLVAAIGSIVWLRELDYSRADLRFVDAARLEGAAHDESIEGIDWAVERYVQAPELAPYREFVRGACPDAGGVALAQCLLAVLNGRFGHGTPPVELFDASYDPAAALALHLSGTRGHCVTRSGLLATALLATGVPARVVQVYAQGSGHTMVSVLDVEAGRWRLLDPTFGIVLSAPGARTAPGVLASVGLSIDPFALPPHEAPAGLPSPTLLHGTVVYPEPWLYTRVGARVGAFPYSARFLVVGAPTFALGLGQWVLPRAAAALGLASVLWLGVLLARARRAGAL